jgi:phage/plasmid-like protein (TIGR03299 family)
MPAVIDSMMYVKEVPWHRLGKRLENPATAAKAIEAAGLGWEVQLQPIYTGADRTVKVKDRFAVCRNDRLDQADGGQLGIVGRDYTPLQNREAFTFLDPLVGENAAIYHTAGSLRQGRRVWLLAKLPGEIRIVGDDIAQKFLLLSNSHDGGSAVRIGLTPIRVVCQNTLNLALRGMAGMAIRHESNVAQRVKQAHELLGLVNESFNQAGEMMQRMARTAVTAKRLGEYFEAVLPSILKNGR